MKLLLLFSLLTTTWAFNGELSELECPDDCDCHYFRVNWVTDCSDSNLTEIPYDELSKNLYVLDLNSNYIKDIKSFPSDFKMHRLQVADNLMTELRYESFAGLQYLIDADFSGNRITKIDPNLFRDSNGFITLELQGNPLEPVHGPFLSINLLLYLDISNCGVGYLNRNFFENVTSLNTLDLSGNPLKSITNEVFHPLGNLEILKMNDCNLTYIANLAFISQVGLKTLELARNSLTEIEWTPVLGVLVRLEYLDLTKSQISNLPEDVFTNTVHLRTLILTGNELVDFDVASTIGNKLHHLDTLDLSHCSLKRPLSNNSFANSTKITNLYLSGNSLFASDLLEALAPLLKLHKLSLSHCGLSVIPDTFHKFSLRELDISYNPLNDAFVRLLTPLKTLEYLNMGYCNLSHMSPMTFSKMTSMKRLVLSGNDLHSLEAGLFGNLTSLESLELNSCGLSRPLNATLFFNNLTYTDLIELQLAGNPLHVSETGPLLPKQLSRLQTLDLSNCNLTFLSPDAFYWTRNITNLILKGNNFNTPNGLRFLKSLPKLEMLDLRYNNLTSLSPNEMTYNPRIQKLKLIGNPWICECSIAELWDWANLEKGNIGILEGSSIAAEHVTVGKTKKKKLLICNYDANKHSLPIIMNKTVAGRKPFLKPSYLVTMMNRTWGKYVRESGCEPTKVHRYARSLTDNQEISARSVRPNNWCRAALIALSVYGVIMLGLLIFYRVKTQNKTVPISPDKTL